VIYEFTSTGFTQVTYTFADTTTAVALGAFTLMTGMANVSGTWCIQLPKSATANPGSSPDYKGFIYYDTINDKARIYDGAVWQSLW
jgi:hypothetical protein